MNFHSDDTEHINEAESDGSVDSTSSLSFHHRMMVRVKGFAKHHFYFTVSIALGVILGLTFVLLGGLTNPSGALKTMVFAVGKDLIQDDTGHTNFLLLGTGGGDHDGADLTDSIIIASLDHERKHVSMISIPRDLYFTTPLTGSNRINAVYEAAKTLKGSSPEALRYFMAQLSEKMNIPLHYYAKIDFDGFVSVVDALGGVDVDVVESIYDPYYPKDETILFEPFSISAGHQTLDGATALKYVRSRKTTSDFDRSRRQQQVIHAIKQKALSVGTLTSPSKIQGLYDSIASHFETNLSVRELVYLAEFAEDFDRSQITLNVLHDDPSRSGGILYTPPRDLYNGMFVLLPVNNDYSVIARYVHMVLYNGAVFNSQLSVQILNGTPVVGRASRLRDYLQLIGFSVPRYGNAQHLDVQKTRLYVRNTDIDQKTLQFVADYFGAELVVGVPEIYQSILYSSQTDLVLEIGQDFKEPSL